MKKLALLAVVLLAPALSQAAPPQGARSQDTRSQQVRVGIGGSVRSDDAAIYIPIELSPAFRLEPFFAWSEVEATSGVASSSNESRQLGAGGFFRMEVHESIQAYAGGRLAYIESEGFGGDLDGFRVEPTVGAEFWVTDRFSVALEAYLFREELDGTSAGVATEIESSGSDTRLLVRFFP